ncbi:hypothetical protein AB0M02_31410 [Actinoplanes sp. NPDC051861]|uniref:hypothetical protein n=1 Tax=Actinoplanes sp. NPDC051861 TaxID=3155170 RepID=UPI003415ACF2
MRELPGRDADEFDWVRYEQAGVFTTAQAIGLIGRAALRRHLSQGRWRSICRGVLLSENGRLAQAQQLWVAVLVAGPGARLAGHTAAAEGGVRALVAEPIEVVVPAVRRCSDRLPKLPADMPGVRVHRTCVLPASHCQVGQPPRTTIARSVVDAASWASGEREAQLMILSACQQRRVDPAELRAVLELLPTARRRRLIKATIADVEGGATALSEVDFLALCRRHHLPAPDTQVHRTDADGRRRFLDAYWKAAHLHVEIDGSHHMSVRQWSDDQVRQNRIWLRGDRILRFPAWLVRTDPAAVAAQLREALDITAPQ